MSLATLMGILALLLTVAALVRPDDQRMLLVMSVGVAFWALHYWLLGTVPGAVVHTIAAVSVMSAHLVQDWSMKARLTVGTYFTAMGVTSAAVFGTGVADLIIAICCIVMTFSQFAACGLPRRYGFLGGELLMLVFALLVGSIPGVAVTISNILANGIGIYRVRRATPAEA